MIVSNLMFNRITRCWGYVLSQRLIIIQSSWLANILKYSFSVIGSTIFVIIIIFVIMVLLIGRHDMSIVRSNITEPTTDIDTSTLSTIDTYIDINDPEITFRKNRWDDDSMDIESSKYILLKLIKLFLTIFKKIPLHHPQ